MSEALLEEGRNTWRFGQADRVSVLVDGDAYFRAFAETAARARRSILILGWDIDSRTVLHPGESGGELPDSLGAFLNELARRNRSLHIHAIDWDWAMIYALEREPLPVIRLGWRTHRRLHFRLDDRHPVGASHHEKIIVVDDAVAFVGGLDLTIHRWDTSEHRPRDPRRALPSGELYGPFHDVQMMVGGEIAALLGDIVRERWRRLTGQRLSPPRGGFDPWPASVPPDIENTRVAISRTRPQYDGQPEVREIETQIIDALRSARHHVYVENQYLTAASIGDALVESLSQEEGPEIVIISRLECSGWLEDTTMGVLRARALRRIRAADHGHRFRIYFPVLPDMGDDAIKVHGKVLVADDRLLRIGSANLCNRSMGLDTECDLAIEAGDERTRAFVADVRNRLLAEHLGTEPARVAEALAETGSLVETVERLRGGERSVEPLDGEVPEWRDRIIPEGAIIDPERPMRAETLLGERLAEEARDTAHRPFLRGAIVVATVIALAALWRWGPLSDLIHPSQLAEWVLPFRESPLVPLLVPAVFIVAGAAVFPITILVLATILAFGPLQGFVYALWGSFACAAALYPVGRLLGRHSVSMIAPRYVNRLSRLLARRGLLAVATVRFFPVAPFTVINLVAGAMEVPYGTYLAGTVIGMVPGMAGLAIFGAELGRALRSPGPWSIAGLVVVATLLAAGGVWLRKRAREKEETLAP